MTDKRSEAALRYRLWYASPRWRQLRAEQLAREPNCAMCAAIGKLTPATIVDHRTPHRGAFELFFAGANLASLCKPHHDATKARIERGRGAWQPVGADGWPL